MTPLKEGASRMSRIQRLLLAIAIAASLLVGSAIGVPQVRASLGEFVSYSQVQIGQLSAGTTVPGVYIAPGGQFQIGQSGAAVLTGIYPVSIPITSTALNQFANNSQLVTATVPGLVTATNATADCTMSAFTTSTTGEPTGVILGQVVFLTGTSPVTGSGAANLLIQVQLINVSAVTNSSAAGTMHCDVYTTTL